MLEMVVFVFILITVAMIVIAIAGCALFMAKCNELTIDVKYDSKNLVHKERKES